MDSLVTGTSSWHSVPMTDGLMLTRRPIRDEILLHLDLWRKGQRGCAVSSVIMPPTHLTAQMPKWKEKKCVEIHKDEGLSFLLCTITHSNTDIHTLIHFRAKGLAVCTLLPPSQIECQPECQTMRDGSSSCQYLQIHAASYWTKPCFGTAAFSQTRH